MSKLLPFELDPIFRENLNPRIPCADCGKIIEFRHARIVAVDIGEKRNGHPAKEKSLDELVRNTVRLILCEECWRRDHPVEPKPEFIQ